MNDVIRTLDLSSYKYKENQKQPILKKIDHNNEKKEVVVGYRDVEIEREYPTDMVKKEYADLLGNSGISQRPEFYILGRDKHKRNLLADKIENSANGSIDLDSKEYAMIESAADELGGAIRRNHSILLTRIYDAPTKQN